MCDKCKMSGGTADWLYFNKSNNKGVLIDNKNRLCVFASVDNIFEFEINYCPSCGQKLVKESEGDENGSEQV